MEAALSVGKLLLLASAFALLAGLIFGGSRVERALDRLDEDGWPAVVMGMTSAMKMRKKALPLTEIGTVAEAVAVMGGDATVARHLGVHRSELTRMRRAGIVDRGFFAQFFMTLTALGYSPRPELFGLQSWRTVVLPGGKPARRVA
jgi:hypothetical protein